MVTSFVLNTGREIHARSDWPPTEVLAMTDSSEIKVGTTVEVHSSESGLLPGLVQELYIANDAPPQQHRAVVRTSNGLFDTAVDRLVPASGEEAALVEEVLADV
mgnify:CR=1 FL=1